MSDLGLKASEEEIGRLFDALDKDGGGTLDGHELKHALKDLVGEADATTKRVRQMERAVLERAKSAKESQDAWKAKEVALLRTEAAEAERQRLAAEAREAAAAKEKAAQRAHECGSLKRKVSYTFVPRPSNDTFRSEKKNLHELFRPHPVTFVSVRRSRRSARLPRWRRQLSRRVSRRDPS